MIGTSAVTKPTELATIACSRSTLAVISSTQCSRNVDIAVVIHCRLWNSECATTGWNALSCNCPASAAMVSVTSQPANTNAT